MKGLEPIRLTTPDPKSGAATNYATSAVHNVMWRKGTINFGLAKYPVQIISTNPMQADSQVLR